MTCDRCNHLMHQGHHQERESMSQGAFFVTEVFTHECGNCGVSVGVRYPPIPLHVLEELKQRRAQ